MPKLLPSKAIIKVLERKGFIFVSQKAVILNTGNTEALF